MVKMLTIYHKRKESNAFTEKILLLAGEVAKRLPDYLKSAEEYFEPLTVTEKQVLGLMAQGLSYQEIGKMTGKKVGTVKFHSAGIFRKLQVKNRQQAVNRANEIGLI